jgi:4-amino-4-deoxy-L-arabinose transferase-like glycosyltransferase
MLCSQLATLDMGMTFFVSANLYCFLAPRRTQLFRQQEHAAILCAWVRSALAVLSKALIGVVPRAMTLIASTGYRPRLARPAKGMLAASDHR